MLFQTLWKHDWLSKNVNGNIYITDTNELNLHYLEYEGSKSLISIYVTKLKVKIKYKLSCNEDQSDSKFDFSNCNLNST